MLEETLAIEREAGEGRDDVRIAEHPDVEEQNRPEPSGVDHDRSAGGQRPARNQNDQREVELRVAQPSEGRPPIARGWDDESAGYTRHRCRSDGLRVARKLARDMP